MTTKDDERWMRVALDEAHKAQERDEVPIGAVVVSRGRIVARGHNLTETLTDVTAHAEMQAITAAAVLDVCRGFRLEPGEPRGVWCRR